MKIFKTKLEILAKRLEVRGQKSVVKSGQNSESGRNSRAKRAEFIVKWAELMQCQSKVYFTKNGIFTKISSERMEYPTVTTQKNPNSVTGQISKNIRKILGEFLKIKGNIHRNARHDTRKGNFQLSNMLDTLPIVRF